MNKQSQYNQANLEHTLKVHPSSSRQEALDAFHTTLAEGSSHKTATKLALDAAYENEPGKHKRAKRTAGLTVSGYVVNAEKRFTLWRENRTTKKNDPTEGAVGVYVWQIVKWTVLGGIASAVIAFIVLTIMGVLGAFTPLFIPMLFIVFGLLIGAIIGWIKATLVLEHRSEEHEQEHNSSADEAEPTPITRAA